MVLVLPSSLILKLNDFLRARLTSLGLLKGVNLAVVPSINSEFLSTIVVHEDSAYATISNGHLRNV